MSQRTSSNLLKKTLPHSFIQNYPLVNYIWQNLSCVYVRTGTLLSLSTALWGMPESSQDWELPIMDHAWEPLSPTYPLLQKPKASWDSNEECSQVKGTNPGSWVVAEQDIDVGQPENGTKLLVPFSNYSKSPGNVRGFRIIQMLIQHVQPLVSIRKTCTKCQYFLRSWFSYCSWNAPHTSFFSFWFSF